MSTFKTEPIKTSGKRKKELEERVAQINGFYNQYSRRLKVTNPNDVEERKQASDFLMRQTKNLRNEIKTYMALGYTEEESLDRVLPKAYATVKVASNFLWKKPHYDVQLIGGILLNEGFASEMATGEGKTLTAVLPTYLNALLGKGAHVITPNGYLAKRDFEEMSELYELMGLSCGLAEERGKLDEADITAKVIEILDAKLDKYTETAKNEAERQQMIIDYLRDKRNAVEVAQARNLARTALTKEGELRRKQAYQADVTYGSASAIAFDYLYDDIATDAQNMVHRKGNPNFVVIDEMDAVLFDDATTPFSLSGTQTDDELAISEEDRKLEEAKIRKANYAIYRIFKENEDLIERNKTTGQKDRLILKIKDEHSFENIAADYSGKSEEYDMTRAIIINSSTKEYKLTTLGLSIVFQYYCDKDIRKYLKEHKEEIINTKYESGPMYREGLDYVIEKNGEIKMEPRAFAHLVESGLVPELTARFNRFSIDEYRENQARIDNSITAWFILEEDVDYKLSVPSDSKKPTERIISLVMNGRTAEGRVYSNGLQQAIEEKEDLLKKGKLTIKPTKIKNTLASIPTASFFQRYDKFAGMTGTAAIDAFKDLYGILTHEVPRNKPRQVIDHGDRFYASTDSKNEAIFQEVLASYKKQQPVLLSTTSIEESEKLFRYLKKRFNDEKIDINIPVLNANVEDMEQEATIISKAGLPGAITISTEMAGRGTDIKLGGEVPEISDLIKVVAEERVVSMMNGLTKSGVINAETHDKFEAQVRKRVNADIEGLEKEAIKRRTVIKANRDKMERQVLEIGGLKVIGSGHFSYSRVDGQVKGRCGRQGNKGEVIFFNDREDLLKVGVPKTKVDQLQEAARRGPIIEDPQKGYTPVYDAIYDAQSKTEALVQASIKHSQEVEKEVSHFRKHLREQKEELKRSGDYIDAVEYMIGETVKSMIVTSAENSFTSLRDATKTSKAKINYEEFAQMATDFLGIDFDIEELKQFKTLGELREYVTSKGNELFDNRIKTEGREKTNAACKEIVDRCLARTWHDFEDYVETIKHQDMLNRMAQVAVENSIPPQITTAFLHCVESERAMIVREVIYPNYRDKLKEGEEPRYELAPVRVTPLGVQRVAKDYDQKAAEEIRQMHEEALEEKANASNIKNLQPHPRIFTLVNKSKLCKDSSVLGTTGKAPTDDEVESVDFGDGPKGKK